MNERREVIVCVAECRDLLKAALRALLRPEPDVRAALAMLGRISKKCEETIKNASDEECRAHDGC